MHVVRKLFAHKFFHSNGKLVSWEFRCQCYSTEIRIENEMERQTFTLLYIDMLEHVKRKNNIWLLNIWWEFRCVIPVTLIGFIIWQRINCQKFFSIYILLEQHLNEAYRTHLVATTTTTTIMLTRWQSTACCV